MSESTASPTPEAAKPGNSAGVPRQSWVTRVIRLTRKELRETLRDRRTIVTLVVMPLLLYPLISVVFQQFMILNAGVSEDFRWNVAVRREPDFVKLMYYLQMGDNWLRVHGEGPRERKEPDPLGEQKPAAPSLTQPKLKEPTLGTINPQFDDNLGGLSQLLERGDADVVVLLSEDPDEENGPVSVELQFRPNSSYGREMADFIGRRIRAANESLLYSELKSRGGSDTPRLAVKLKPLAIQDDSIQIASLIPLILILMTMTGAVYPAIDLTAGERERGTLEALMAAPVPRLGLLIAKYLAVLTVALLTAVVNLTAMTITLQVSGLGKFLLGPQGLAFSTVLAVLGLLILFAAFFSAVMLTVTSFARSFKEAQAYLIPLVLLALAPGFLSLLPGLQLRGVLAITPLANIVLLSRDLLQERADPIAAATAVITTALYALAALAFAAKIFGSDAVLYGSQGSWSELIRRPLEPKPTATLAQGATTIAILYPCYFLASGLVGQMSAETPLQTKLWASAAGTVAVFLLIPLLMTWWTRRQFRTTLQLGPPSVLSVLGAVLLGVSVWPFAHELIMLAQKLGFATLPESLAELVTKFAEYTERLRQMPLPIVLIAIAIAPAVCEEIFFRGYLQTALQQKLPAWGAILISAAVFGVFHISVGGLAILERVISSAMLGLLLGWICWRSGSIWPGMLLHMIHNGSLMLLNRYKDALQQLDWVKQIGWNPENQTDVPLSLLLPAGVIAVVGLALVWAGGKTTRQVPKLL